MCLPLGVSWGGKLFAFARRLPSGVRKGFLLPGVALRDTLDMLVLLEELDSDMEGCMLTKATEAPEQQKKKADVGDRGHRTAKHNNDKG